MSNHYYESIERVAVIGAGTMGAAIAQHFLMKDLDVVLIDVSQSGLDKGCDHIRESLAEAVARNILSDEKMAAMLRGLTASTDYAQLADRQFVVEAVFENMEVKQNVFKQVEAHAPADCLIASNTSSFSITELGSVLDKQDRFLGVHYFYHAAKNKLVELIPGEKTAADAITALSNFYFDIDKAPIVVKDVYGFAVNRFFVPWLNEAVRIYEDGVGSISVIDEVAREVLGIGMGPFALMNATGVPITLHAARTLEEHFGAMYAPAERLVEIVEAKQDWNLEDNSCPISERAEISKRLLAMSLGVAAQMVDEGVAGATETDLGARLGLRWPAGPFELMNKLGIEEVRAAVTEVFAKYDHQLPGILATVDAGQGFVLDHVRAHVIGNTGLLEFNRPDAMNALSPVVVNSLHKSFLVLDANPDIDKIVLFGRGKAFVAGADVKFFIESMQAGNLERVRDFAARGQSLLTALANSSKQTIAFLDGLTLGGGLELALACDARIATSRFSAAFPETGIGIYPGLGGTQRSTRVLGKALAKYLVATGAVLDAQQARDYGLVSDIVDSTNRLEEIAQLTVGIVSANTAGLPELVFENFDGLLDTDFSRGEAFQPYRKILAKKAPLAMQTAMELIDDGELLPLDDALQLELDHLVKIFATQDAITGLRCLMAGKRPEYLGR